MMDDHSQTDPQAPLAAHDAQEPGEQGDPRGPAEHVLDVPVSRTRAYDAYVLGLPEWWHPGWTASGTGLDRIEVEPHEGGRIVEHARDGSESEWGAVTEAEPGARFGHTISLRQGDAPSTVMVTFADLPHGGTRVLLQHSPAEGGGAARLPDWPLLLERYRGYATHV